nr:hypothetical protein [Kofleriaceae bacterium]
MAPASAQLDESQQEAANSYSRAQQAQDVARQKARDADHAQQVAIDKQHEAVDAQREARRAREDAEAAQQQAIVIGREAQQRASAAQQRAVAEQPVAEQQTASAAPLETVTGRIARISDDSIVVRRDGAPDLTLHVDDKTAAVQDGQPIRHGDLARGAQVTVSYRLVHDQPIADMVQATRSSEPVAPPEAQPATVNPNTAPQRPL